MNICNVLVDADDNDPDDDEDENDDAVEIEEDDELNNKWAEFINIIST